MRLQLGNWVLFFNPLGSFCRQGLRVDVGLQGAVVALIKESPKELWQTLLKRIVLTGGVINARGLSYSIL